MFNRFLAAAIVVILATACGSSPTEPSLNGNGSPTEPNSSGPANLSGTWEGEGSPSQYSGWRFEITDDQGQLSGTYMRYDGATGAITGYLESPPVSVSYLRPVAKLELLGELDDSLVPSIIGWYQGTWVQEDVLHGQTLEASTESSDSVGYFMNLRRTSR